MKIKVVLWMFVMLLLATNVLSLGISPVKHAVDFESGLEKEFKLSIVNNEEKDFTAIITVEGKLKDYITLKQKEINVKSTDKLKTIRYSLNLPDTFDKPGIHEGEIVVFEKVAENNENNIKAMAAIGSKIYVRVLHNGSYLDAKLYIDSKDKSISFLIPVVNHGNKEIKHAFADIQILNENNVVVDTISSDAIKVGIGKEGKLNAKWNADVDPGTYHAKVTITYDGKEILLEKDFTVGGNLLDVIRVGVREFILGDIAKFDIYLENKLNQKIDEVYGEIIIVDDKGGQETKFRTVPIEIESKDIGKLEAYWDTKEISVGKYYMNLMIHYMGKVTEKIIELDVNIDSIKTNFAPTGQVIGSEFASETDSKKVLGIVVIIFIIVIIGINIFWFKYMKRMKKKR